MSQIQDIGGRMIPLSKLKTRKKNSPKVTNPVENHRIKFNLQLKKAAKIYFPKELSNVNLILKSKKNSINFKQIYKNKETNT